MFIPQVSKLAQATAPADLLASQPTPVSDIKPASSFGNMLQQSFKAPDRPSSPVEVRRTENRAIEPKRTDPQRSTRDSNPSTNKTSPGKSETAEQRSPADGTNGAQTQTETSSAAKSPADQGGAASPAETATAETAATGPASFAVLSSIIAALSNAVPTETKLAGSAGTTAAVDAPLEDDLLADPKRQLVALAAKGAGDQAAPAETDEADALLPKLPVSGDEGDAATAKPAASEAKPLVGPASTAQPASLTQANGAATAPAVNGLQGELTAGTLNTNGVGGPHRAESQSVQQLPVYTPAGHKAWAEDVGNRLIWMANRSESRAELMLTPPSLGKLGVSIQVSGDQTTAQFVAATPAAREALEQAMPRLRELLQQAGINLGQTDVSTSGDQQAREGASREGRDPAGRGGGGPHAGSDVEAERPIATSWTTGGNGVIDIFA